MTGALLGGFIALLVSAGVAALALVAMESWLADMELRLLRIEQRLIDLAECMEDPDQ